MSQAKTAAERKADERRRHKEAGRVAVTLHAHPDDIPAIRARAAELQSARTEAAAKLTAKRTQPTARRKKP